MISLFEFLSNWGSAVDHICQIMAPNWAILWPNGTILGLFKIIFQSWPNVLNALRADHETSHKSPNLSSLWFRIVRIGSKRDKVGTFGAKMYWNLFWKKSPNFSHLGPIRPNMVLNMATQLDFVQFGMNLPQFSPKCAPVSTYLICLSSVSSSVYLRFPRWNSVTLNSSTVMLSEVSGYL